MERMIVSLILFAAVLYMIYRGYRFFIKKEVNGCLYGEAYWWRDNRGKTPRDK